MSTKQKRPWITGEKNPGWKGKGVSRRVLHKWVQRKLGTPDKCEFCGKSGLGVHQIEWANKSGKYKRDLTDWMRLCVTCHRRFDWARRKTLFFWRIKIFNKTLEIRLRKNN